MALEPTACHTRPSRTGFSSSTGLLAGVSLCTLKDPTHLKEVAFESVNETFSLTMLARCAYRDAVIFNNVANAKTISRSRPEAKLAERGIAAVRG